jgi:hypothetical protein
MLIFNPTGPGGVGHFPFAPTRTIPPSNLPAAPVSTQVFLGPPAKGGPVPVVPVVKTGPDMQPPTSLPDGGGTFRSPGYLGTPTVPVVASTGAGPLSGIGDLFGGLGTSIGNLLPGGPTPAPGSAQAQPNSGILLVVIAIVVILVLKR